MYTPFLTVTVKCKPVVKAFLENNFGTSVTIPDEHIIFKLITSQLFKKNTRDDQDCVDYPVSVDIMIPAKSFNFDGFNINKVNTRAFNTGVESFIKNLTRSNLDSLLILQEKQNNWKEKYKSVLDDTVKELSITNKKQLAALIRKLENEVNAFRFDIKTAIQTVVTDTLKLDFNTLNYETVKKDYYRYRMKNISTRNVPQYKTQ